MGERPNPDGPHPGKRRLPRAPSCRRHSAQSLHALAPAVRLVTGPHARIPRHSQAVGSGPRPHAQKDESSGVGKRPTPDASHPGKRRPPRAPSCRLHSAQSQLARARTVGLVTGPHARIPRAHRQWEVDPGHTPERTSGRGWESARPRTPRPRQEARPPGTLIPPPQGAKPARKSACCGVGDGSPRPQRPHPQPVGSGPGRTPERTTGRGWESARPRTPRTKARGPPPRALLCRPYSELGQHARQGPRSARGGVGDGSPRPHPPHGGRAARSQVGGNGTGPPPPRQAKRSTGRRQDTRRGTD